VNSGQETEKLAARRTVGEGKITRLLLFHGDEAAGNFSLSPVIVRID
jgi:hypothetical protein